MQHKLTKVTRYTEDKDGNPLKTKDGRPYTRLIVSTEDHPNDNVSGFGNDQNKDWKVGDTVEMTIEQRGQYWNFKMPNQRGAIGSFTEHDRTMLQAIFNATAMKNVPREVKESVVDYPTDEINPDDIPF